MVESVKLQNLESHYLKLRAGQSSYCGWGDKKKCRSGDDDTKMLFTVSEIPLKPGSCRLDDRFLSPTLRGCVTCLPFPCLVKCYGISLIYPVCLLPAFDRFFLQISAANVEYGELKTA